MENYELSSDLRRINSQVDHLERKIEMSGSDFKRKIERKNSDIEFKISMLQFNVLGLLALVIFLNFFILFQLGELLPN